GACDAQRWNRAVHHQIGVTKHRAGLESREARSIVLVGAAPPADYRLTAAAEWRGTVKQRGHRPRKPRVTRWNRDVAHHTMLEIRKQHVLERHDRPVTPGPLFIKNAVVDRVHARIVLPFQRLRWLGNRSIQGDAIVHIIDSVITNYGTVIAPSG